MFEFKKIGEINFMSVIQLKLVQKDQTNPEMCQINSVQYGGNIIKPKNP